MRSVRRKRGGPKKKNRWWWAERGGKKYVGSISEIALNIIDGVLFVLWCIPAAAVVLLCCLCAYIVDDWLLFAKSKMAGEQF